MTARDRSQPTSPDLDRLLAAWFEAEARVHAPDDLLDRTIARTARRRPRPAWLLPERWIPMELTMRRARFPRAVAYAVLAATLILLAVIALLTVGSQRRVPPPFGPAANGSLYFATNDGDIVGVDVMTSSSTFLTRDVDPNAHPSMSLDGQRVAVVRSEADGSHIDVVDVGDGSTVRVTTSPLDHTPTSLRWSPDGRQLAWIANGALWMAATNGSGSQPVETGLVVSDIAWRPPDGAELLIRAAPNGLAGLYLMRPDGSDLHPITAVDGTEYAYTAADWSPDGKRLAYSSSPPNIVHVLTVDGLVDQVVPPRPGAIGTMFPRWSPDGTRIALVDWRREGDGRVALVNADDLDGSMVNIGPSFSQGPDFVWSPDGSTILAIGWDSSEPWLLDPTTGEGHKTDWPLPGDQSNEGGENTLLNVWQRLSP